MAPWRAIPFLLLGLASAEVKEISEAEIQRQIVELQHQLESLESMEAALIKDTEGRRAARRLSPGHVDRKLNATTATNPPSIFGDSATTRAYAATEDLSIAMDHCWLIVCGALVMFMQAGFAMVEAGTCRAKNVQNILLKNLTDVAMGTLGWWFSGWALAYSGPYDDDGFLANKFMGHDSWFGSGFLGYTRDQIEPTTTMLGWFFQWAFCSAAATIVSGGVAERVNFPGYLIFSFWMTAFMYPIVVAWTWGYGWLASVTAVGYMDFAGSGIVHMSGGVGALVGAIVAGPRNGRFEMPDAFTPHSMPLIILGTFILWFGWYGFNCGSTLELHTAWKGMMAAQVAMNTTIAAATGGLTVFIVRLALLRGKYDIGGFCNGILAGLVSITAGCGNVECGTAFAIALLGGFLYQGASMLLQKLRVDDPIDAFAVHGACGAWGTLAAAFFDWGAGVDYYNGWSGFNCVVDDNGACLKGAWGAGVGANVLEVLIIALWMAFWSALIFIPLRMVGFLRASDDVQEQGFDTAKHSPSKAYAHGGENSARVDSDWEAQEAERLRLEEEARIEALKNQKFKPIDRGDAMPAKKAVVEEEKPEQPKQEAPKKKPKVRAKPKPKPTPEPEPIEEPVEPEPQYVEC